MKNNDSLQILLQSIPVAVIINVLIFAFGFYFQFAITNGYLFLMIGVPAFILSIIFTLKNR